MSSSTSEPPVDAPAPATGKSDEDDTGTWVPAVAVADLDVDDVVGVEIGDLQIAVYRLSEDEFRATGNVCTHAFAYLSEGWLEDGEIECPLHGGRFDVRTGRGLCAPLTEDVATFPVRVVDGVVRIRIN